MVAQITRETQKPRNAAFFRPRSIVAPHLRYSYFDASYSGSRAGFVVTLQFFERCGKARGGWLAIFELCNHRIGFIELSFRNGFGFVSPATTCRAHSKYCCFLSRSHPAGGLARMDRRLEILSAS